MEKNFTVKCFATIIIHQVTHIVLLILIAVNNIIIIWKATSFNKPARIFLYLCLKLDFKTEPRTLKYDTSNTQPLIPKLESWE